MIVVVYSQILAAFKVVVHIASAATIMWYFYRVANGQFGLL
jgi:hypothetical protein